MSFKVIQNYSALQSRKWQLIGMSQWCRSALSGHPLPAITDNYIHLYSPERQQQQVKEAPNTQQQQKTNKIEKNYAQIGRASEQCYHIYTPTNSKTSVNQR